MEHAVRLGSPDSPTTAHVSASSSIHATVSGSCQLRVTFHTVRGPRHRYPLVG